mgnify:CR=1 FL=1
MLAAIANRIRDAVASVFQSGPANSDIEIRLFEGGFACEHDGNAMNIVHWGNVHSIDAGWAKGSHRQTIMLIFHLDRGGPPVRICDEQPGWIEFTKQMQKVFPEIQSDWQFDVREPNRWPPTPDFTVLYRRS